MRLAPTILASVIVATGCGRFGFSAGGRDASHDDSASVLDAGSGDAGSDVEASTVELDVRTMDVDEDAAEVGILDRGAADLAVTDLVTTDVAVADERPDALVDAWTTDASGAPVCGNGIVERGELCDRTTTERTTCASRGFAGGGVIRCNLGCDAYDTTNCAPAITCGNGAVDPGEACDGADLTGLDCATVMTGFRGGTLGCAADCASFDTSRCLPGRTISSASCSDTDVQAAIDIAADGDTVFVPAGTCTWRSTVTMSAKNVALIGAAAGQTIIRDGTTDTMTAPYVPGDALLLVAQDGQPVRIAHFVFEEPNGDRALAFYGPTRAFRFDHCTVRQLTARAMIAQIRGDVRGVIDHNRFEVGSDSWDIAADNTSSWGRAARLGDGDGLFFEDNEFLAVANHRYGVGAYEGARFVFRYNATDGNAFVTGFLDGTRRGAVTTEIYENRFDSTLGPSFTPIGLGGGTGVIFSNSAASDWSAFAVVAYPRSCGTAPPHRCDGRPDVVADGVSDGNLPLVGGSGTHSDPSSTTLTDATKSWLPNTWVGYWVHAIAPARACLITSSGATTVVCSPATRFTWSTGDAYTITNGWPCLDQIGRGPDADRDGVQDSAPFYAWDNSIPGRTPGVSLHDPSGCTQPGLADHLVEGRDFLNEVPMPGYRSYVYPHPVARSP